jgi:hypothetical protein
MWNLGKRKGFCLSCRELQVGLFGIHLHYGWIKTYGDV